MKTILGIGLAMMAAVGMAAPLKVYILAGQSNMEGHAHVKTIEVMKDNPKTAAMYKEIKDGDGFKTADNAWISYFTGGRNGNFEVNGKLTAGYGSRPSAESGEKIGPEYTFGLHMDKATTEPVLIIKTAWGGKSLYGDYRPPSAGAYTFNEKELANLKSRGKLEETKKQRAENDGHYYRLMIGHVKKVLADPGKYCSAYNAKDGYEIAGFAWFQGWNDMVNSGVYPDRGKPGGYQAYSDNLAHFIRDVRKDLNAPKMKFVIGVMGVNGEFKHYPKGQQRYLPIHKGFREAMAAPAALPEFKGNVVAVETAPFWDMKLELIERKFAEVNSFSRALKSKHKDSPNADGKMSPADQKAAVAKKQDELVSEEEAAYRQAARSNSGYHYMGSAITMSQIGKAFAEAMLKLEGR
jgi:alpha-galactosidase